MNEVGYDAVVPGNHDYDFGPLGWLVDQVPNAASDDDRRGALLRLVQTARFPLLSANTFLKSSMVSVADRPIAVQGSGCKPGPDDLPIDWARARAPAFLRPTLIREVAVGRA